MRKKQSARQRHYGHLFWESYRRGHGAFFFVRYVRWRKSKRTERDSLTRWNVKTLKRQHNPPLQRCNALTIQRGGAIPNARKCSSDICPSISVAAATETYTRADPQQARSTREAAPSLPIPIALTATSTFLAATKSINRVSCAGVSVRVASLKISAPYVFAARA